MEMRAYMEGIGRKWWLLILILVASFLIGNLISNDMTSTYTASTSIVINEQLITNSSFPSGTISFNPNTDYAGEAGSLVVLNRITESYPWLKTTQLQKSLTITVDGTDQFMMISMTSISPFASADIANYIAHQFIQSQTEQLASELNYYNQSLQQKILLLNNQVNQLNAQIDTLTSQVTRVGQTTTLTPAQKKTLAEDENARNQADSTLYVDQQTLAEVQKVLPLIPKAFEIIKPAEIPVLPTISPLSNTSIEAIALAIGLLVFLIISVALDFSSSKIRHKGELPGIVGVDVLAELPQLFGAEQKRLVFSQSILFTSRIRQLRLLCATLSALAHKKPGYTLLLTSPKKKRRFATVMAMFLARKGMKTLLIDADFDNPGLHKQVNIEGPAHLFALSGSPLPFIGKTTQPDLYFLAADAFVVDEQRIPASTLLEMLPILQGVFDILVIDAPPMNNPDTHLLATKMTQVLMLIKKRHDRLREVQTTHTISETLKLRTRYLFLT